MAEIRDTSLSDFHWVSLLLITIEWTLDLGSVHLELSEGAGTEGIRADNADFPAFLHIVVRELGASGSLASTLQTNEHDDVRATSLELICLIRAGKHISELVNDSLLDNSAELSG